MLGKSLGSSRTYTQTVPLNLVGFCSCNSIAGVAKAALPSFVYHLYIYRLPKRGLKTEGGGSISPDGTIMSNIIILHVSFLKGHPHLLARSWMLFGYEIYLYLVVDLIGCFCPIDDNLFPVFCSPGVYNVVIQRRKWVHTASYLAADSRCRAVKYSTI